MKIQFLLTIAFNILLFFNTAQAQTKTLFTYGDIPVSVEEFDKVYTKNNINNQANYSEKSVREYLELFINFKLKTKEALAQSIDTISALKSELAGYRKQLAQAYLTDMDLQEKIIEEGYNRLQWDVNVSHILVKCPIDANPADSLLAFNKMKAIQLMLAKKGADFNAIAKEKSEDPSAKINKGNIGFITAFMITYPFENLAYNTEKGKISNIIRTKFGYHILKVEDKRPARGKMIAAHILVKLSDTATAAEKEKAKKTIDDIYNDIKSGKTTFDEASALSDDKFTADKKGELPEFGVNRMVKEFEDAAFSLNNDGDISAPIMTKFGWHIVKRISKSKPKTLEQSKKEIKALIEKDERSTAPKISFYNLVKKQYGFTEYPSPKTALFNAIPDSAFENFQWDFMSFKDNQSLFKIGTSFGTQREYLEYLVKYYRRNFGKPKNTTLENAYKAFVEERLTAYEEMNLEAKYPKFRDLMKEYSDGVYLFELTDRAVWGRASKDTTGLKKFFEANKGKYTWGKRAVVTVFNATDEKIAKAAYKMASSANTPDAITKKLNKDSKSKISFFEGKFERGKYNLVDSIEWKIGLSPLKKNSDNSYTFVQVNAITTGDIKELNEARGYYVSDYQNYLEKEWIKSLRAKYPVKVEEETVKSIIKP